MSSPTTPGIANDAMPPAGRTRLAQRPNRTAIGTTLGWNVLPALAVVVWFVLAARSSRISDGTGEDWGALLALVVLVIVGGAILVAAGVGAAITAFLVRRRLGRAAAAGQPGITVRTAILLGSAGAGLGWVGGVAAVFLIPAGLGFISTLTS